MVISPYISLPLRSPQIKKGIAPTTTHFALRYATVITAIRKVCARYCVHSGQNSKMSYREDFGGRSSQLPVTFLKPSALTTSIQHPKYNKFDAESVRVFLLLYDQYGNEVKAFALQLGNENPEDSTRARPVNRKFYVNAEHLESTISLGFIPDVSNYDDLTDVHLCEFLKSEAEEWKEKTTLATLDSVSLLPNAHTLH